VQMLEDVAGHHADALTRFDLAETISSFGDMLVRQRNHVNASREFYQRGVRLIKRIDVEELPDEARMAVGMWHLQLGYLDEGVAAEKSARSAIAIFEKIANGPGTSIALSHMTNGLVALARSLVWQGRFKEAKKVINRIQTLVEELPEDLKFRLLLSRLTLLEVHCLLLEHGWASALLLAKRRRRRIHAAA